MQTAKCMLILKYIDQNRYLFIKKRTQNIALTHSKSKMYSTFVIFRFMFCSCTNTMILFLHIPKYIHVFDVSIDTPVIFGC